MIRKSSRARAKLLCTSHLLIVKLHKPSKNKPKDLFPNIFPTKRLPHNFQRILLTNVVIFFTKFFVQLYIRLRRVYCFIFNRVYI